MRGLIIIILLNIIALASFVMWKDVDLQVTSFFYDQEFYLSDSWWAIAIYNIVTIYAWAFMTVAILMLGFQFFSFMKNKGSSEIKQKFKPVMFLISVMILGPGILVHYVLKPMIGRARPRHVEDFGGDEEFSYFFQGTDIEGKSFVSGHSAAAFTLCAVALVMPKKYRNLTYVSGLVFGVFSGFARVVQGGHFTSDVVFAGLLTLMLIHGLYIIFFSKTDFKKSTI